MLSSLAIVLFCVLPTSFAQSTEPLSKSAFDFNGMVTGRYNSSKEAKVKAIQESIVFNFTVSPEDVFDLVGSLQTGSGYSKRFASVIDFNDHSKDQFVQTLYFKNLYLQKKFKLFDYDSAAQFGVLGTDQKIGMKSSVGPTTAIGSNSWVEGARLKLDTHLGSFSLTGGSLNDVTQADIIKRARKLNYLEFQFSKKILEELSVESSAGTMDGQSFLRAAIEESVSAMHALRLIQEFFYNIQTKSASYSAGATADIGEFFKMDLRYSYNNTDVGLRGKTMNDLYLKGNIVTVGLYGKVNQSGALSWFSSCDFGDQSRFQTGMTLKFAK